MSKKQIYTDEKETTWKLEYIPTSNDSGYFCGTILAIHAGPPHRRVGNMVTDDSLKDLIQTIETLD